MMALLLVPIAAVAVPSVVRDSAYDWRCVADDDVVVSSHQRQDRAITACQSAAEGEPGRVYYVEGGRYRVVAEAPTPRAEPAETPFHLDLPEATLTLRITGPEQSFRTETLISQGDWGGEYFGIWTWNGQVHARLGRGIYRPAGSNLVPGQAQTVTVGWGSAGFTVMVDGETIIRDPANTRGMVAGEPSIAAPTTPWSVAPKYEVCATIINEPLAARCPAEPATLNQEPVPCV